MKMTSTLVAAFSFLAAASASFGQAVSFTQGAFTDNTVLSLAGTPASVLYAIDFGNTSSPFITDNGYTFQTYPTGPATNTNVTNLGTLNLDPFMDGYAGTSTDVSFNSIMDTALFSFGNNTFTLNNLQIGTTYNALFLITDVRTNPEIPGRTFTITSGTDTSLTQVYAFATGIPSMGGYAMGTFTATGASQAFTVNAPDGMLNALVVTAVPEPSSIALLALAGAAGLAIRRRIANKRA